MDLGKCCPDDSNFIFDRIFIRLASNEHSYKIFIRLAGNEHSYKILDEFNFGTDQIIHMKVTCPLVSHRHIWGKCCPDDSDFMFY